MTTLRAMTHADLAAVLSWRNHPQVRAASFTQHEIGFEEHAAWFALASADGARRIFIAEDKGTPLGLVAFRGVAAGGVFEWSFYAAEGAPRGSGRKLCTAALQEAFGPLGASKVYGEALAGNLPSVRIHESLGFKREGVLRRQRRLVSGEYADVVCFGLLDNEWKALGK